MWYGMRAWIEHGFKLLKHGGWQWQMTRMTDPDRASRLWLVLAVATRYVLAVGGEADAAEMPVETLPELAPTSRTTRTAGRVTGRSAQTRRPVACPDTFVASAQEASLGDQTTLGERLSTRIGGVGQHSDRRTCVAKTPMETRTVVGDSSQFQEHALINPRHLFRKTPPSERGGGEPHRDGLNVGLGVARKIATGGRWPWRAHILGDQLAWVMCVCNDVLEF